MADPSRQLPPASDSAAADLDFTQWTLDQARWLRLGRFDRIDCHRLAEEIEDVGRSEYAALESDLTVLLHHILKWDHQPARRTRSWILTIREHRRRITRRLQSNPSLRPRLAIALEAAFQDGRDRALAETGLPDAAIGSVCPYSTQDIMAREYVLD